MPRHRTNTPRVAAETLDGEVLLIDMTTGAYFSAVDAGAVLFTVLANGAARDEAIAVLVARYGVDEATAGAAHDELLAAALADDLLCARADDEPPAADLLAGYDGGEHPWGELGIDKSTEIADLILLDPVHDVGEGGWPSRPA